MQFYSLTNYRFEKQLDNFFENTYAVGLSARKKSSVVKSLIFKSALNTCSKSSLANSPEEFQAKETRNEFGIGLKSPLKAKN